MSVIVFNFHHCIVCDWLSSGFARLLFRLLLFHWGCWETFSSLLTLLLTFTIALFVVRLKLFGLICLRRWHPVVDLAGGVQGGLRRRIVALEAHIQRIGDFSLLLETCRFVSKVVIIVLGVWWVIVFLDWNQVVFINALVTHFLSFHALLELMERFDISAWEGTLFHFLLELDHIKFNWSVIVLILFMSASVLAGPFFEHCIRTATTANAHCQCTPKNGDTD